VDAPVMSQTRDFLVLMISDSSSAKGCLLEICRSSI
jgi:hypothetical protein